jgi:hypothetical protein
MTPITIIEEQVAKVLSHSQGIAEASPSAMLKQWYEAKKNFIEHWDDYIYEVPEPITFHLSKEEKRGRFNEFVDSIDNTYNNKDLVYFLDWLTVDEVFSNHLNRDYEINDNTKIAKNTKVSKALKYFENDEFVLRKVQDQLSTIIQEDKITGTLCFSVHPLDYLSASENTYHWRSCHALDGDYRSGNLQYMMDTSTVICYLRGAQNQKLPNFPEDVRWNSKKWRMLLFLSDHQNAMFAGRQYPFFSPSALDIIKDAFLVSIDKRPTPWSVWYNDFLKSFPRDSAASQGFYAPSEDTWLQGRHISMNGEIYKMTSLIQEPRPRLFYNDLLESSCYIPYYCWNHYTGDKISFHIGASVLCPFCGENSLQHSELMCCDKCYEGTELDDYIYCDRCDRRIPVRDAYYIETEDYTVCSDCYETDVMTCDRCGEAWLSVNIQYHRDAEEYQCPVCRGIKRGPWGFTLPF